MPQYFIIAGGWECNEEGLIQTEKGLLDAAVSN